MISVHQLQVTVQRIIAPKKVAVDTSTHIRFSMKKMTKAKMSQNIKRIRSRDLALTHTHPQNLIKYDKMRRDRRTPAAS